MSQPDFSQVCGQFQQFRAILGQALASPGDAAVKQQLQSLTATLDKSFADLQQAYPQAQAAIDAQLAGVHQSAGQTSGQITAIKEAIAAATTCTTAAMPTPAAPDSELGQKLREELLAMFGKPEKVAAGAAGGREIWQDWNWQDWSNN